LRGPREFEQFKALDPTISLAVCHMQDLSAARVTAAARALFAETEGPAGAETERAAIEPGAADAIEIETVRSGEGDRNG
jgi:hypothetical protein